MAMRIAGVVLLLIAIAGGTAAVLRYRSHAFDPAPYLRAQRLVALEDGRRLNLYCTGRGTPTVLLDAGLGGTTLTWRFVQPALASSTTVCSYDRAGMGFSDPGPLPRSSAAAVADMHALVERAPLARPLILVGHSLGGMNVRLYAYRYPRDVAGMVIVDGADEDERATDLAISRAFWDSQVSVPMRALRACRARAERSARDPADDMGDCAPPRPRYGAALNAERVRQARDPRGWDTQISELQSYDSVSERELRASRHPYGAMPIVVLTHGIAWDEPGVSAAESARIEAAFLRIHQREAADSTRGENRVVAGSGHNVQLDRPAAVVDAVHDVIAAARGAR